MREAKRAREAGQGAARDVRGARPRIILDTEAGDVDIDLRSTSDDDAGEDDDSEGNDP